MARTIKFQLPAFMIAIYFSDIQNGSAMNRTWSFIQIFFPILIKSIAGVFRNLANPEAAHTAVIVGLSKMSLEFSKKCAPDKNSEFSIQGFFDDRKYPEKFHETAPPLLGAISELADYVKSRKIRYIFIALPIYGNPRILRIIRELRDTTASVYFLPELQLFDPLYTHYRKVGGVALLSVHETPLMGLKYAGKRLIDILLSVLGIALLAPVLICTGVAVRLTSSGSIIFRQRRYGLGGEEIIVYKYRSMVVNDDGPAIQQARRNDPRLTPIGDFLRRTSLDELPQLFNVLRGDMSIVGPRPHAVAHNEIYRSLIDGYMLRHKIKPGITGWAQVHGLRGETETTEKMAARVAHDLFYLRNWSFWLDIVIILKTFKVVFSKENAH